MRKFSEIIIPFLFVQKNAIGIDFFHLKRGVILKIFKLQNEEFSIVLIFMISYSSHLLPTHMCNQSSFCIIATHLTLISKI